MTYLITCYTLIKKSIYILYYNTIYAFRSLHLKGLNTLKNVLAYIITMCRTICLI